MQEDKMRRQMAKEEFMRQREEENRWRAEMRYSVHDMYVTFTSSWCMVLCILGDFIATVWL